MRHSMIAMTCLLVLAASGCDRKDAATVDAQSPPKPANAAAQAPVELIPRASLFGNPERANVQTSPDGHYLSWIAPVDGVLNVWVAPANDLNQARAITRDKARGIRNYAWSHRPGTLLYVRDNGGDENFHVFAADVDSGTARDLSNFPNTRADLSGISRKHPDAILVTMNDRDPKWPDLYRVDLASGKRDLLQKNTDQIANWLADDDFKVRLATRSRKDGGTDVLKPDANGKWSKVDDIPFEDSMGTRSIGFTSDGKTLYLADSRGRNTSALVAMDVDSGARQVLAEDTRADISAWLQDPVSGKMQAVAADYLKEEWTLLDPAIAADLKALAAMGPGEPQVVSRTDDDKTWIIAYDAADAPTAYYRYSRGAAPEKLFSTRPALDGKPLAPMWPQEIKARDGMTLPSYLTLPRGADADNDGKADHPVPMVLFVHGGPWGRDDYGYSGYPQWLANRGYAVLQVNYRGSTGFGKDFVNKADGQWAAKMHDDLIDAVEWAVQQGVTGKDQVAIMGGSYGGYATLVGLTFTPDTFKCGVDIVGPSNLNTLLGTIPPYWAAMFEQFAKRIGDPRTEAGKQLLAERSPITHVDRISKPLLIGQGANDPRVKQDESDQIVKAMTAKNIPVTYALFPDEGHGFARPENSKAFNAVAEAFLGKCLGGQVEPIGGDFAGSSISVPNGADALPGLAEALKTHTPQVRK